MPALVDVWRIDLERDADRLLAHVDLVGATERRRSEAFVRPADRIAYLASHVGLRMVLSTYGCMSGDFCRDGSGKPRLTGAPEFSLSRTRGAAVVAVGDRPVGVDIEAVRPVRITEPAVTWVAAQRRTSLLAAWTALEAWAKWRGCGVGPLLQSLDAEPKSRSAWWASARPLLSAPDAGQPSGFHTTVCSDSPSSAVCFGVLHIGAENSSRNPVCASRPRQSRALHQRRVRIAAIGTNHPIHHGIERH